MAERHRAGCHAGRTVIRAALLTAWYGALTLGVPAGSLAQVAAPAGAQTGAAAGAQVPERSAPVSDDPVLEERTRQVAAELRCPVCQGNSIQDSPSELAQEMKGVVRDQLASGKSPDEVKAYFVQKYGEWILLEPKASGFNLVVYLLPMVMVLAGAAVIWRAVKKWTTSAEGDSSGVVSGGNTPDQVG